MANEAYRAVFLRVHPTGKMVLSLTTGPDGREREYAQQVAEGLGVPGARREGGAGRHGPVRRRLRASTTNPSGGTSAAIVRATGKILAKAQLLAGVALGAGPETLTWSNGAWVSGDGSDPTQVKTVEDIALYAHGTGALPPGVEAGSTPRPSTGTDGRPALRRASGRGQPRVDRQLDPVDTFSAPNRVE